mgnify:CR=1 FL=1
MQGLHQHCVLTVNRFEGGRQVYQRKPMRTRSRPGKIKKEVPNLFDYKFRRVFGYEPLTADQAPRGVIGIPRVLNMYEDFPFWAVFFRELGFSVLLSPQSTRQLYELGIESIPSESECYPAKLVHGHITWLIKQGVQDISIPVFPTRGMKLPMPETITTAPWLPPMQKT